MNLDERKFFGYPSKSKFQLEFEKYFKSPRNKTQSLGLDLLLITPKMTSGDVFITCSFPRSINHQITVEDLKS